jgi:hypothetical protein
MSGDKTNRDGMGREKIAIGESRKGVQVIDTPGMPEGYVPPSASLSPPPKPRPSSEVTSTIQTGDSD